MLGLNDKYLARHPPRSFGTGQIGHELGNGKYVLERRPDIIAFNGAAGARDPMFLSGREMMQMPAFRDNYQFVRARGDHGNRVVGLLWIRREDSVLGVKRTADSIEIPGYFFASDEAIARPGTRRPPRHAGQRALCREAPRAPGSGGHLDARARAGRPRRARPVPLRRRLDRARRQRLHTRRAGSRGRVGRRER